MATHADALLAQLDRIAASNLPAPDSPSGGLFTVTAMVLDWHDTAPGLLYEAGGDSGRRDVVAFDGERWTLDLFQHSEYEAGQQIDPHNASSVEEAKRPAQDWETELLTGRPEAFDVSEPGVAAHGSKQRIRPCPLIRVVRARLIEARRTTSPLLNFRVTSPTLTSSTVGSPKEVRV